jgi:cytochrome c heme-lyase
MEGNNKASSSSTAASSRGGCPVDHSAATSTNTNTSSVSRFPWPWATTAATNVSTNSSTDIISRPIDNKANATPAALSYQPASIEEAAQHAQTPQPDQRLALGTHRQVSSIPRAKDSDVSALGSSSSSCPVSSSTTTTTAPHHQHDTSQQHWVYPSEQQLYNAMRRKGWTNIPEDSISTVLNIHNTINERTWKHIQEWEHSEDLTLVRFQGRPTEPSPKAWLLCHLLKLYDPPFDRHDWYVQHNNTTTNDSSPPTLQRYVIDYYYTQDPHTQLPRPYIDARPALDHPRALWLRGQQFFMDAFPAIGRRVMAMRRTNDGSGGGESERMPRQTNG